MENEKGIFYAAGKTAILGSIALYEGVMTTVCSFDYFNHGFERDGFSMENYLGAMGAPVLGVIAGVALYKIGSTAADFIFRRRV